MHGGMPAYFLFHCLRNKKKPFSKILTLRQSPDMFIIEILYDDLYSMYLLL